MIIFAVIPTTCREIVNRINLAVRVLAGDGAHGDACISSNIIESGYS